MGSSPHAVLATAVLPLSRKALGAGLLKRKQPLHWAIARLPLARRLLRRNTALTFRNTQIRSAR
jgi:hypothetical protein